MSEQSSNDEKAAFVAGMLFVCLALGVFAAGFFAGRNSAEQRIEAIEKEVNR